MQSSVPYRTPHVLWRLNSSGNFARDPPRLVARPCLTGRVWPRIGGSGDGAIRGHGRDRMRSAQSIEPTGVPNIPAPSDPPRVVLWRATWQPNRRPFLILEYTEVWPGVCLSVALVSSEFLRCGCRGGGAIMMKQKVIRTASLSLFFCCQALR